MNVKETLEGWSEDISLCTKWEDLPDNAKKYVLRPGWFRGMQRHTRLREQMQDPRTLGHPYLLGAMARLAWLTLLLLAVGQCC